MKEKRRRARCPANEQTHVFWTDSQGRFWQEHAPVTDISSEGLGLILRTRPAERTQVGLRSNAGSATITGTVRHVRQKGLRFLTGVELPTQV